MAVTTIDGDTRVRMSMLAGAIASFAGLVALLASAKSDLSHLSKSHEKLMTDQEHYQNRVLVELEAIKNNTATNGKDVAVLRTEQISLRRRIDDIEVRLRNIEGKK